MVLHIWVLPRISKFSPFFTTFTLTTFTIYRGDFVSLAKDFQLLEPPCCSVRSWQGRVPWGGWANLPSSTHQLESSSKPSSCFHRRTVIHPTITILQYHPTQISLTAYKRKILPSHTPGTRQRRKKQNSSERKYFSVLRTQLWVFFFFFFQLRLREGAKKRQIMRVWGKWGVDRSSPVL